MARRKKNKFKSLVNFFVYLVKNRWLILGSMCGLFLTLISMYFNANVGFWSASTFLGSVLMAGAYAILDLELLFLVRQLTVGIKSFFLKVSSVLCIALLFFLSLWAGITYYLAQDAKANLDINNQQIERLEKKIAKAQARVDTWQANFDGTEKHKSKFDQKLENATLKLDSYEDQLITLQHKTPPASLVVFNKISPYLPSFLKPEDFQNIIRLAFALGIIFSSFLCVAVANEGRGSKEEEHTESDDKKAVDKPNAPERTPLHLEEQNRYMVRSSVSDEIYEQIKNKVLSGAVRCSHKDIKAQGIGSATATAVLKRMERGGYIELTGRGYKLKSNYLPSEKVLRLVN